MWTLYTAHKMKFPIKDFFSKCDQIPSFLQIWSHLLRKSLIENFIFCAVILMYQYWTAVFQRRGFEKKDIVFYV